MYFILACAHLRTLTETLYVLQISASGTTVRYLVGDAVHQLGIETPE